MAARSFGSRFCRFLQDKDPRVVASDTAATAFFLKTFGPSLELSGGPLQRRRTPPPLPKALRQHLPPFVTNLATWHLTHDLLTALDQGKPALMQTILEQRQRQIEWLKRTQPDLPGLLALVKTIAQLQPPAPSTQPLSPSDAVFTQFLHEQYPDWTGTPDSWLTLAQTEGVTGVQTRLRNSWERRPARDSRHEEPDPAPSIDRFSPAILSADSHGSRQGRPLAIAGQQRTASMDDVAGDPRMEQQSKK